MPAWKPGTRVQIRNEGPKVWTVWSNGSKAGTRWLVDDAKATREEKCRNLLLANSYLTGIRS